MWFDFDRWWRFGSLAHFLRHIITTLLIALINVKRNKFSIQKIEVHRFVFKDFRKSSFQYLSFFGVFITRNIVATLNEFLLQSISMYASQIVSVIKRICHWFALIFHFIVKLVRIYIETRSTDKYSFNFKLLFYFARNGTSKFIIVLNNTSIYYSLFTPISTSHFDFLWSGGGRVHGKRKFHVVKTQLQIERKH